MEKEESGRDAAEALERSNLLPTSVRALMLSEGGGNPGAQGQLSRQGRCGKRQWHENWEWI